MRSPAEPPPTVSGRWLLAALGISIVAAAVCCWGVLCLLFWQGSWQLLYHPKNTVKSTPASVGLKFDAVGFWAADTGQTRLSGWWMAAEPDAAGLDATARRYTVLCLHGQDGNLGDSVDWLAELHGLGVNVFAFDYRGYGKSEFVRPSEKRWREDAEQAIQYLTNTRHIAPDAIVLAGDQLGANLALEVAAAHPELGGVIVREPMPDAMDKVFGDARARLVPAHWLVSDRYDMDAAARALLTPSMWLIRNDPLPNLDMVRKNEIYEKVTARKMLMWVDADPASAAKQRDEALARWFGDLRPGAVN